MSHCHYGLLKRKRRGKNEIMMYYIDIEVTIHNIDSIYTHTYIRIDRSQERRREDARKQGEGGGEGRGGR